MNNDRNLAIFSEFTPEQMRNVFAYIIAAKHRGCGITIFTPLDERAIEIKKKRIEENSGNSISSFVRFEKCTKEEFWKKLLKSEEKSTIFVLDNVICNAMAFWAGANIRKEIVVEGYVFRNGKCVDCLFRDEYLKNIF
ncbi:MAG: hypothetical protein ABIK73_07845 [candidate division WOR-3 bacterium]